VRDLDRDSVEKNYARALDVAEIGLKTGVEPFREPEKSWGSGSAAKVMAATGLDILQDPRLLKMMRDEWTSKTKGKPYLSPLPPDLQPPVKK